MQIRGKFKNLCSPSFWAELAEEKFSKEFSKVYRFWARMNVASANIFHAERRYAKDNLVSIKFSFLSRIYVPFLFI
jgi:hypothetical protein